LVGWRTDRRQLVCFRTSMAHLKRNHEDFV